VKSKVFELEEAVDAVRNENADLRKDNEALRESLRNTQRKVKNLEQYGRRYLKS
jgi:phage shock protein A